MTPESHDKTDSAQKSSAVNTQTSQKIKKNKKDEGEAQEVDGGKGEVSERRKARTR